MNDKRVSQWLSEHNIVLEPSFVTTLKAYGRVCKKRPACIMPVSEL